MSKQTSQMYGIKVKETINYAEMGDIALYYEDALWTVKSNFENVWRDGVHYDKGDTIVTFQDGEVATFTMMGQHTDVSPYINKLYNIYSNASENPQAGNISVEYRITNSDRPHGGYSEVYEIVIFKLVNGLIQDRKYISSEDVRKYKINFDHKPVPAWNLTVDWNYTNPQSGYPMKSWVIRSNSNYIKYEEQYYSVGQDLEVFEYNDPILMAIVDETQQHETKKKVGEPPLVVVTERVDGGKPTSWSYNRENIVHDVLHTHKDVYYNGHRHKAMYLLYSKTSVAGAYKTVKSLAFAWADPYWFLVTNSEGMEYNGQILKKGQLVKAWSPGDSLNLYIKKDTAVRKPKTDIPYDNITYELLTTGDTSVTVIRLVNDEEPPDSRVVVTTSDSPKVCWGIELRVEGPDWTIYSKNNFIKYNGRTYKKNKSILSFGLNEELHIEIKDEENKYYIKSSMTYHVTNEAADSINYKVRTNKLSHDIIIEKSVNGNEEPWQRVKLYDAIIIPYDYEDLSLEFNNVSRKWILRALSDNVYSDGVKYDTNETIAEWPYTEIKELNHIEALKDSEENIKVAVNVTGVSTEFGQDFDEFVPDDYKDFEVLHSSTKALWKILSNTDDAWSSGINYRKGDVILEVPDKTFVDPFTVSVRYYDETQHAYAYRTYSISLTYNALENKTNLIIDPSSGNPIVFNDKTVNEGAIYSITKQNAKSMYGYIWKRDMPGPGPYSGYSVFVGLRIDFSGSYCKALILAVNPYDNDFKLVTKYTSPLRFSMVPWVYYGESRYMNRLFICGGDGIFFVDNYSEALKRIGNITYSWINYVPNVCIQGKNELYTYYTSGTVQPYSVAYTKVRFADDGSIISRRDGSIPSGSDSASQVAGYGGYIFGGSINTGHLSFDINTDSTFYAMALDASSDGIFRAFSWTRTDEEHQIHAFCQLQELHRISETNPVWEVIQGLTIDNKRCFNDASWSITVGHKLYIYHRLRWVSYDFDTRTGDNGDLGIQVQILDADTGTGSSTACSMSESEMIEHSKHITRSVVKYGDTYYVYEKEYSGTRLFIYEFNESDGSFTLVETKNENEYVTMNLYGANGKYADVRVYFKSMPFRYVSSGLYEVGILSVRNGVGNYNGNLLSSAKFICTEVSRQNSNEKAYIFFDNPYLNMGINNFALDGAYF